jgi:CheY-like chemotaxis protein
MALVIDDDDDIRELLRALLESSGFEVDTCRDGIEALTVTKSYDVILLDVKMPIFDGRRLTDYWQLTDPGLLRRVIMLTGYSRATALPEHTTFAMVPKPFQIESLLRTIEACAAQTSP